MNSTDQGTLKCVIIMYTPIQGNEIRIENTVNASIPLDRGPLSRLLTIEGYNLPPVYQKDLTGKLRDTLTRGGVQINTIEDFAFGAYYTGGSYIDYENNHMGFQKVGIITHDIREKSSDDYRPKFVNYVNRYIKVPLRGGRGGSKVVAKSKPSKWVSTGRKVTLRGKPPREKTVYRNTASGELRVRNVTTAVNGTRRYSYVKF